MKNDQPKTAWISIISLILFLMALGPRSARAIEPQTLFNFQATPSRVAGVSLPSLIPLNGARPQSGLTLGPDRNLYGTTGNGGSNNAGTIFKLMPDGTVTSVFSFSMTNGQAPHASLTLGRDGNFYGTTSLGGPNLLGTIFRFSTNGALTTLAAFGGTNGGNPQGQLVEGADGSFYGTAPEQGPGGFGTVFRVTTNGVLTTIVSFDTTNGANPEDGLTLGQDGNFYGTSADGGILAAGTIFRMTPGGMLTNLFVFDDTNGSVPLGALVQGDDGTLYGTTAFGGNFGTIFKITTNGALTTMFNFHFTDGEQPSSKLIFGPDGNLYGTTGNGGVTNSNPNGLGTVFRITTNGVFTTLLLFQGTNGSNPAAPLVIGGDGNLYGTTAHGGTGGGGTIFRIVLTPQFTGIAKVANGNVSLSGMGPSASSYRLWASTDLSSPFASWTLLTNGLFAEDGTFSYTDMGAGTIPVRFYRVTTP